MSKVKQVLKWHNLGCSIREIAQKTSVDKNTVHTYIKKAKEDELSLEELMEMNDYSLAIRWGHGKGPNPDSRYDVFKELFPYFFEQMRDKKNHMTLLKLWEEYVADHPDSHYNLTQFRKYYALEKRALEGEKVSTLMADQYVPGLKVMIDFAGSKLRYFDSTSHQEVYAELFVACCPASGMTFAMAVNSQKTVDFINAIVKCLRFFGAVPRILVPDNLKAAITKYKDGMPIINNELEKLANYYGMVVEPTRPRKPKDKANVEGMVKILYQRIYPDLQREFFFSIEEMNNKIAELVKKHNQTLMTNYPWTREERFLDWEKPKMLPLPNEDYEMSICKELKVQLNCCVLYGRDSHWYSAPYKYVGQRVHVEVTSSLVKIFSQQDGELIATHKYSPIKGKYTVVNNHMASQSKDWRDRGKKRYIQQASRIMPELARVFEVMYSDDKPEELHYKSCDGLLHLQKKTSIDVFKKACQLAIEKEHCSYKYIKHIIDKGYAAGKKEAKRSPNPSHDNVRGPEAFM